MHELMITKELIRIVLKECRGTPGTIKLELGKLTSFKREPIRFYFDELKKEHDILKDAILDIKEIDGVIECRQCKKRHIIDEPLSIFCLSCGSPDIIFIKGRDLDLIEICAKK